MGEVEEAALVRLFGIAMGVAVFGIVPIETGNYFSNSAFDITRRFLANLPEEGEGAGWLAIWGVWEACQSWTRTQMGATGAWACTWP